MIVIRERSAWSLTCTYILWWVCVPSRPRAWWFAFDVFFFFLNMNDRFVCVQFTRLLCVLCASQRYVFFVQRRTVWNRYPHKTWIGPDRITDRITDWITDPITDWITDRITDHVTDHESYHPTGIFFLFCARPLCIHFHGCFEGCCVVLQRTKASERYVSFFNQEGHWDFRSCYFGYF